MTLAELLDELRGNVLRDTSPLVAGASDRYWSDASLVRYLDEAQLRFARQTLCLRDESTDSVTAVYLNSGINTYLLSPLVLAVLSATADGIPLNLVRTGQVNAFSHGVQNELQIGHCLPVMPPELTGSPLAYSTDDQVGPNGSIQVRVFPTPGDLQEGVRVQFRVCRLPLARLRLDDLSVVPEIPDIYHLDLVEWAAFRALRNWDVDGEDRTKANMHRERFEQAIQEAQREMRHKVFAPMGWVFGRHGFSW